MQLIFVFLVIFALIIGLIKLTAFCVEAGLIKSVIKDVAMGIIIGVIVLSIMAFISIAL